MNVEFIIGTATEFINAPLIHVSFAGVLRIKLTFAIAMCLELFTFGAANFKILFPVVATFIVFV